MRMHLYLCLYCFNLLSNVHSLKFFFFMFVFSFSVINEVNEDQTSFRLFGMLHDFLW